LSAALAWIGGILKINFGEMVVLSNFPPPTNGIRHEQPSTTVHINDREIGKGTLFITERLVIISLKVDRGFCTTTSRVLLRVIWGFYGGNCKRHCSVECAVVFGRNLGSWRQQIPPWFRWLSTIRQGVTFQMWRPVVSRFCGFFTKFK